MMVRKIRGFLVRFRQQLILIGKTVLRPRGVAVLLEQAAELQRAPYRGKAFQAFRAKRAHALRVQVEMRDLCQM